MSDPQVVHNEVDHRFEAHTEGELAQLDYRMNGNRLVLVHTEVPEALEGHGTGGALVRAAVEHAVRHALTVVPSCAFARDWLEHHPDVAARVQIDWSTAGTS